jgi:hypothetical protein
VKQVLPGWSWYWWEGGRFGEMVKRVHMVQILCKHVCKWKNVSAEAILRMGGRRRMLEMLEGMNSTKIYGICCKNFCKCHNAPRLNNNKKNCTPVEEMPGTVVDIKATLSC